jgi:hypothetical protein
MAKHVHSKDPRKPMIVSALKRKSGGTKVTELVETEPGVFRGRCLRVHGPKRFELIDCFTVTIDDMTPNERTLFAGVSSRMAEAPLAEGEVRTSTFCAFCLGRSGDHKESAALCSAKGRVIRVMMKAMNAEFWHIEHAISRGQIKLDEAARELLAAEAKA